MAKIGDAVSLSKQALRELNMEKSESHHKVLQGTSIHPFIAHSER